MSAEDPDMMAAEFALGLLEGEGAAAARRRLLTDPQFAADVARWRDHLEVLFSEWPDAAPPPDMLARIEAALPAGAAGAVAAQPPPAAANDNRGWGWKALAGISTLAAAALAGVLVLRPAPVPPAPIVVAAAPAPLLVAALAPSDAGAPIAAAYQPATRELRVAAASLADREHSAELWVIADDKVPHSLGVLRERARTDIAVRADLGARFAPGASLVVTLEQPGGSPDGTPKGKAVAAGTLVRL